MKLNNKYFILRHGQTAYQVKNKNLIYPNYKNDLVFLTEKGKKQVKDSVKKIKSQKIDIVYFSDLKRTKQTAKIATQILDIKEIKSDKRLRDINLGIYHGKIKEEFYVNFPKFSTRLLYNRPKKGENWMDCKKRMKNFIKEINKKYKNKRILIVSHGDPLWLLEGIIKKLKTSELTKNKRKIFLKTGELKKLN